MRFSPFCILKSIEIYFLSLLSFIFFYLLSIAFPSPSPAREVLFPVLYRQVTACRPHADESTILFVANQFSGYLFFLVNYNFQTILQILYFVKVLFILSYFINSPVADADRHHHRKGSPVQFRFRLGIYPHQAKTVHPAPENQGEKVLPHYHLSLSLR